MTTQQQKLVERRQVTFHLVMVLLTLGAIASIYVGTTVYRAHQLYSYAKGRDRGWRGTVHRADAELGFAPIPDSRGAHVFPVGPDIEMRYDRDGFRVPVDGYSTFTKKRPLVLALGCSFTYGDATPAEHTFAYLVGLYLGGTTRNAGVCSYGLSQMLLLSRKLVAALRPDYLLVQYSPWLIHRAISPFAPAYFGQLPTPYFFDDAQGLSLQPPVFDAKVVGLPMDRYRETPKGIFDALSFYWHVALPLYTHDDWNMLAYGLKRALGGVPAPTTDRSALVRDVYGEIGRIADQFDARLVIVVLGHNSNRISVDAGQFPSNALLVNAHDSLLAHLKPVSDDAFAEKYAHWRGSPPVIVDRHPNEVAHRIIAESIVSSIREASTDGNAELEQ